jgi:hypothetical protein
VNFINGIELHHIAPGEPGIEEISTDGEVEKKESSTASKLPSNPPDDCPAGSKRIAKMYIKQIIIQGFKR